LPYYGGCFSPSSPGVEFSLPPPPPVRRGDGPGGTGTQRALTQRKYTPNARTPQLLLPMRKSNRTTARNKFKTEQYIPPLPNSKEQNTMVARSRGGGRSAKCDSGGRKTNPYRPATSQQQEVPAGTAIAQRGHRRVPRLGGAPENEPARGPIIQALVPSIRSAQSGQRKDPNDHRSPAIKLRLGSTPQNSKPTAGKPWGSSCH